MLMSFYVQVTETFARLGHTEAQHYLAQRLLHGRGVRPDKVRYSIVPGTAVTAWQRSSAR
jgi:hypothetical protein